MIVGRITIIYFMKHFLYFIVYFSVVLLSPITSSAEEYPVNLEITVEQSDEDLAKQEEEALKISRERMRQLYIDNCMKRAQQNSKSSLKIRLVSCKISKKDVFEMVYSINSMPNVDFERGKDIPLRKHYPKMFSALCENSDDFVDAEIAYVRVIYTYNDKNIQSNLLDLNDCFISN